MSLTNQEKVDRIRLMRDAGRKNADIADAVGLSAYEFSRFLRACIDAGVEIPRAQVDGRPRVAVDLSGVK